MQVPAQRQGPGYLLDQVTGVGGRCSQCKTAEGSPLSRLKGGDLCWVRLPTELAPYSHSMT